MLVRGRVTGGNFYMREIVHLSEIASPEKQQALGDHEIVYYAKKNAYA
jgi:hypothetical protein